MGGWAWRNSSLYMCVKGVDGLTIDCLERDWKLGQLTQCNTYTPRYGGSIPEVAYSGLLMCNTRSALKS